LIEAGNRLGTASAEHLAFAPLGSPMQMLFVRAFL
jgi:hypothetical protein